MKYFVIVLMLLVQGCGGGKMVSLSWVPPSYNVDGSELAEADISHYELRWGTERDNLNHSKIIKAPSNQTVVKLVPGTYYFRITAIVYEGVTSDESNTVTRGVGL